MARLGYSGGLSRQPAKMDTGGLNFMQGMAAVQAMQQSQQAHEQALEQNEIKMSLAQAENERADRLVDIKEQEAYRNQVAFDVGVSQGNTRVATWNGKTRPSWASAQLGTEYDNLSSLHRRIADGRKSGRDVTADVLAFQQLASQYDARYQQEAGQRRLSNEVGELNRIYEATGLQPEAEIAGLLDAVQSNESGVGYTQTTLDANARKAISQELARARMYEQEFAVRLGLKSDLDSMREILTMLRAGQTPPDMNISDDVKTKIQGYKLNSKDKDYDDQGASTLGELVALLDPAGDNAIDAWDPDADVSDLQDKLRKAKSLWSIVSAGAGAMGEHDLSLQVQQRMKRERAMFAERNSVAELVRRMRLENPEGPLSPIEIWAARHHDSVRDNNFSLDYDNDTEYVNMWKAITDKAKLLGGDTRAAVVAMNEAWRAAAPARQKWSEMEKAPTPYIKEYEGDYYKAYVADVLASQTQLEESYSSADPRVDAVVNLVPEKTAAERVKANDSLAPVYLLPSEEGGRMSDRRIRMFSDASEYSWGGMRDKARFSADKALSIALKQAGISRADYFGYEFKRMATRSEDMFKSRTELDLSNQRVYEATRTTFAEFAEAEPDKAAELLYALQNPDAAWQKAWDDRSTAPTNYRLGEDSAVIGWSGKAEGARVSPKEGRTRRKKLEQQRSLDEARFGAQRGQDVQPVKRTAKELTDMADGPNADPEAFNDLMASFGEPTAPQVANPDAMTVEMSPEDMERTMLRGDGPEQPYATQDLRNKGMDFEAMLATDGAETEADVRAREQAMREDIEAASLRTLSGNRGPEPQASPYAPPMELYKQIARGDVENARGAAIYRVAQDKVKSMRLDQVKAELAKLQARRSKSGNGKLTLPDAAMYAVLMARQEALQKR